MRIAILSDIHANLTALEAVVADVRVTSPDLVLLGGDLADAGSSPVAVIDRIRDLGWEGVLGNTDEMLFSPESLQKFAFQHPSLEDLFRVVEEMAAATRDALGEQRLAWLATLPRIRKEANLALMHATPEDLWRAPLPEAIDSELEAVYSTLEKPVAVYAHVHRPFVRRLPGLTVVNSGSVGLPYDGDRRASYVLIEDHSAVIRRIPYDVDAEKALLSESRLPHAEWIARLLTTASFQMPLSG